jgi:hypothetical protein
MVFLCVCHPIAWLSSGGRLEVRSGSENDIVVLQILMWNVPHLNLDNNQFSEWNEIALRLNSCNWNGRTNNWTFTFHAMMKIAAEGPVKHLVTSHPSSAAH